MDTTSVRQCSGQQLHLRQKFLLLLAGRLLRQTGRSFDVTAVPGLQTEGITDPTQDPQVLTMASASMLICGDCVNEEEGNVVIMEASRASLAMPDTYTDF